MSRVMVTVSRVLRRLSLPTSSPSSRSRQLLAAKFQPQPSVKRFLGAASRWPLDGVYVVGWTGRETVGGRGLVKGAAVSVAPPTGQLEKTFESIRPKNELIDAG